MGKRGTITLPVDGGMQASGGDANAIPANKTQRAVNVHVRPGRLEKRYGWQRETNNPTTSEYLFRYADTGNAQDVLVGLAERMSSVEYSYSKSDGTWSQLFSPRTVDGMTHADAVSSGGRLYATWTIDGTDANGLYACGTDVISNTPAAAGLAQPGIGGASITTIGNRLVIGSATAHPDLYIKDCTYDFTDGTDWSMAGGMNVTNTAGLRHLTITNGSTDTATTARSQAFTDTRVTASFDLRPRSATNRMPLRLIIETTTGTVLASQAITLLNATEVPGWTTYTVTAKIDGTKTIRAKIQAGNGSAASPLDSFDVANTNIEDGRRHGFMLTEGRYPFPFSAGADPVNDDVTVTRYRTRFYWSETDDFTYWRATNYIDLPAEPEEITKVHGGTDNRLFVFKANAIYVYRLSEDPDYPFVIERKVQGVGCASESAFISAQGVMYFADRNDVWMWSGDGEPIPLAGVEMRRLILTEPFPHNGDTRPVAENAAFDPAIALHEADRELYVSTGYLGSNTWVLNLDTRAWSVLTEPECTYAAPQDNANSLLYIKPAGRAEAAIYRKPRIGYLLHLERTATQDQTSTGALVDVDAEYCLHPIETPSSRNDVWLERLLLFHRITAAQTNTTLETAVSFDGGTTFSKTNAVTVSPLSTGGTIVMPVELWQSGPRLTVRLTHSGLTGPAYFNVSAARAEVQLLGPAIPDANPIQGFSSL